MEIFNRNKINSKDLESKGYKKVNSNEYTIAEPNYYKKDNNIVGVLPITQDILTLLPKKLSDTFNGNKVNEYKLMFISTTKNDSIGELNYNIALEKLKSKDLTINDNYILIKLSLKEMEELVSNN